MSLFNELKRRNVFRVAIAYLAAAWLLTEVAGTLFPMFGFGDAPARIAVIILAIGFPLFLVFSWVFELTPEGLKLERDIDRTLAVTRKSGKQLDRIIIVLLALALGYFAVDKFVLDPMRDADLVEEATQAGRSQAITESYGDNSIAVLPFVNMSADPEQEYFSDGISEEVLNLLARIPKLRVVSRSSSFSLKGRDVSMSEVAEELNVAHVLEGSVRKDGNRVRVTAQLIEARSDTHLWSQAFETELENIFAVQRAIAVNIARVLKFELLGLIEGGEVQPGAIDAANPAAYVAYLKGRELARMRALDEAIEHLKRSIRLDANFAPAQAQLGIALALAADSPPEAALLATPHLDRARELDPNVPEASGGQALLAIGNEDYESAVEHARQALELNPNYNDAMNWLSMALLKLGRWEEAESVLKRMLASDPLAPLVEYNYTALLIDLGRYEEASNRADLLLMKNPYRGSMAHKGIAFAQGQIADGLYWSLRERSAGRGPMNLGLGLLMGFTWIGEYEEAKRVDPELAIWPDSASGRVLEALETLKKSEEAYPEWGYEIASATGFVLYMDGRIREALPYLERFFREVPHGRRQYWLFRLFPADNEMFMRLALALKMTGDEQEAQAVANIVRRDQAALHAVESKFSWVYRTDAMIAAFDRDPKLVVEVLELAVQFGHRDLQFFDDPIFDGFRDHPRFISLRQELVAILASEREKTLQMICFHNPVPEDWQPLPETCEDVN